MDSVFLKFHLEKDSRFGSVSNAAIIDALKSEALHFKKVGKGPASGCKIDQLREALGSVLKDIDDVTIAFETPDHGILCALWVREIKKRIRVLKSNERNVDGERHKGPSVVESFFKKALKENVPHPRGARAWS